MKADVDHGAIAELAEHYGAKGRAVGRIGVAVGAVVGVLVGAVPLTPLSFVWPIPSTYGLATVLVGLGLGLLFGFVIGDSRARMYHRMAEQARAQLVLEERISRSDARISQLVSALSARARAASQPEPHPEPQPQAQAEAQPVEPPLAPPRPQPVLPPLPPQTPESQLRAVAPPAALSVLPALPQPEHEERQQVAAFGGHSAPPPLSPPLSPPHSG